MSNNTLSVENVEKHTKTLGKEQLSAPDTDNVSIRSSVKQDNASNRSSVKQAQFIQTGILSKGNSDVQKTKDVGSKAEKKPGLAGLLAGEQSPNLSPNLPPLCIYWGWNMELCF